MAAHALAELGALLERDGAAIRAHWEGLDDAQLAAEVEKYRAAVAAAAARLAELGAPLPPADGDAGGGGGGGGAAAAAPAAAADGDADGGAAAAPDADAALGVEGVDWRLGTLADVDPSEWQVPPHCVPIHANVTAFDWAALAAAAQFDVVMMDPPWQLATANPTRGVALGYSQLTDRDIQGLPVPDLQRDGGFLFVWVINAKFQFCLDLFDAWGYELVDEIAWVKTTVNRRLAKSHGFYLQHAKEVCLVGKRGADPPRLARAAGGVGADVILSERRGQSQKPEEIYRLVEALVPGGRYLEIFGRKNNLRDFWVTVGNEVTGQGPPPEDAAAVQAGARPRGAVYGAGR